jgi:hypothetical protein
VALALNVSAMAGMEIADSTTIRVVNFMVFIFGSLARLYIRLEGSSAWRPRRKLF